MPRKQAASQHVYGEGSVYRRADGRWVARGRVGDRIRSFYAPDPETATQKLAAARRPEPTPPAAETVTQYLRRWLSERREELAPTTLRTYRRTIERHLIPQYGTGPLAGLEGRHLRALYAGLRQAGLSAGSVRLLHSILHRALADAVRDGAIERNPADLAPPPRQTPFRARTLSTEQAQQLIAGSVGDRYWPLYTLALNTGMRIGELLGLRWQDVDLERGTLRVRVSLHRTPAPSLGPPKSRSGERTIPLTTQARDALRLQQRQQKEERLRAGATWAGRETVFTTISGDYLWDTTVRKALVRQLRRLDLPVVRVHDLRHTTGTLLHAQGIPLAQIAAILGHARATTTLALYVHANEQMDEQARATLERLFGGDASSPGQASAE